MSADLLIAIVMTIIGASTPILIASLGELVVEKSGVLNLGVEGMMLIGAVAAFAGTTLSGSPWFGIALAMVCGALSSQLFGALVLWFRSNQVATGLALTLFGVGLSALLGDGFVGERVERFTSPFPPELAAHPQWQLIFGHSPIVYLSLVAVPAVMYFLNSTRAGLILRAVGENDLSAHSIGYSVIRVRFAAIAFGGAMAGLAGSYFSLFLTPLWTENLTAGRGWIALALVVFSAWRPWRLLFGAYLFGTVMVLELHAKAAGLTFIPSEAWAALPYLATIVVLALISMQRNGGTSAPACLGKPFSP